MSDKPPVKSYCGGKPNYCRPVDAVNMTLGRVDKTVRRKHVCPEWDFMEIDENSSEFEACLCYPKFDYTDEQLMEEVRRRGFVIRDAQVGKKWVGLTDEEIYDYADKFLYSHGNNYGIKSFGKAIEAKLKEKNT